MYTVKLGLLAFTLLITLGGCASAPKSNAERDGAAERGPDWVYDTAAVFPENRFVSAVGYGLDRESAEKNALGALVSIFGQSVAGETTASYKYAEAVSEGAIDMREKSEIDSAVKTSFAMNSLIGAEIRDRWFDNKDTHYAVAVMERMRCGVLYGDLIESNAGSIRGLTAIPEAERFSLDAYARYGLAATVADANTVFINVLAVLNSAAAALYRDESRPGEFYRLAAREIAQNIPITVSVAGDRAGRIGAAFTQVVTDAGFKSGGEGTRYALEVTVSLEPVDIPQNPNKFVRYVIDATLWDAAAGQVLFPFNINGREGHISIPEAENRAFRAAEDKIRASYAEAFDSYLSQLSQKNGR
jgi:hypothetical protein